MGIFAAILLFPLGIVVGPLLVANFITVLGWGIFSLAPLALLPPPFAPIAQTVLALGLASWLWLLLTIVLTVGIVFALYWIASAGTPVPVAVPPPASPVGLIGGALSPSLTEEFGRGGLVGFNAGLNTVFLLCLIGIGPGAGLVVAVLVGIALLACVPAISNNRVYQVVLSYTALFLPMALPFNLLGWILAAINGAAVVLGVPCAFIIDWTRANVVMHGGVVHGCLRTAFNLCNFTVAHPTVDRFNPWFDDGSPVWPFCPATPPALRFATLDGIVLHEAAHALNVAAFGWIYHLVGFADQFVPMPWSGGTVRGTDAHSELCAESALRSVTVNWLGMWAPSPAAALAANVPAVAGVTPPPDSAGVVVLPPVTTDIATFTPGVAVAVTAPRIACEVNRGIVLASTGPLDADGPMPIGQLWQVLPPAPPAPPAAPLVLVPASPAAATLTGAAANAPVLGPPFTAPFTPNLGGAWRLRLSVTDGADGVPAPTAQPRPLTVPIDVLAATVAAPGPASLAPGGVVTLTATASAIPAPDAAAGVNFAWTLVAAPAGSALPPGPLGNAATLTFTPDVAGPDPANAGAPLPAYVIDLAITQDVTPAAGGADVTLSHTVRVTLT